MKHDGLTFDSARERDRYKDLKLMERAGVIRDIECQARIKIVIGGVPIKYLSGRQMEYRADFRYWDIERDRRVIEDVKMQSGYRPREYEMKKALLLAMGIEIQEV